MLCNGCGELYPEQFLSGSIYGSLCELCESLFVDIGDEAADATHNAQTGVMMPESGEVH